MEQKCQRREHTMWAHRSNEAQMNIEWELTIQLALFNMLSWSCAVFSELQQNGIRKSRQMTLVLSWKEKAAMNIIADTESPINQCDSIGHMWISNIFDSIVIFIAFHFVLPFLNHDLMIISCSILKAHSYIGISFNGLH